MRDWQELFQRIGPLRYQTSACDCVPVSIINGLMVVTGGKVHPKLLNLIWSVSLDNHRKGTGHVCSALLSDLLSNWFQMSSLDSYNKKEQPYYSELLLSDSVNLGNNNKISRCINGGGVACLTTESGKHYTLLLDQEDGFYLGFDPEWKDKVRKAVDKESFKKYKGLVNCAWSRDKLECLLAKDENKWVHLIGIRRSGPA